jgi:hypothetical protein
VFKLISSPNSAARSALLMAVAGLLLIPFDYLLKPWERRIYARATKPNKPLIIVVGPPRSGTTLVAQYLINQFSVGYLNNLTSLFPRSPIAANRLFMSADRFRRGDYRAFYGKSRRLSGANDGLYIWDRWLGQDRHQVPKTLLNDGASMSKVFGALTDFVDRPIVNKVNRLNTCAELVVDEIENVSFVCLHRDPLFLAQSLFLARTEILGDVDSPYGTEHDNRHLDDPIEDVCQQVMFHEQCARKQQQILGEERFTIISYESFCENPEAFAQAIAARVPALELRSDGTAEEAEFRASRKRKMESDDFDRMRSRLKALGAGSDVNLWTY